MSVSLPKRIAIVSPGFLPVPAIRGGAIELFIEKTAPFLQKDWDVTVFSIADSQLKQRIPYRYIRNGDLSRSLFSIFHFKDGRWQYIHQVGKILEKSKFDLIYFQGDPLIYLYLLRNFNFRTHMIFHAQNDFLTNLTKTDTQLLFSKTDRIIFCSDYLKQSLLSKYPVGTPRLEVVKNGVDLKIYQSVSNAKSIRQKLNIPQNDIVFCFSGRFVPEKGLLPLIKAFKKIHSKHSHTHLIILGAKENTKAHLLFYAQAKLLADTTGVHWVGFVPPNQLASYYKASDVFVGPSLWQEPLGIVFLEAMAAGLPVITTQRGGIPEIVANNRNGIVLKGTDQQIEKKLPQAMESLLKNINLRSKIKVQNIKDVRQYDWKILADQLDEIFSSTTQTLPYRFKA